MNHFEKIQTADQYCESGDYIKAHGLYTEAFNEITNGLSQASTVQKVAKVGGWVAAILTGGIGLEDAIIVPVVNKALLSIFGIDLKKSLELADYSLCGIVSCVPNIPKNAVANADMLMNYYLILYRMRVRDDQKTAFKDILELVNPFARDDSVIVLSPKVSKDETEAMLMELMFNNFQGRDDLNLLLLQTLHHLDQTQSPVFEALCSAYTGYNEESSPTEHNMTVEKAKAILGIPDNVCSITKSDLMKFRNDKIRDYHPDKYNNLPPEFLEVAKQKTIEINEAYEFLSAYTNKQQET